MVFKQKLILAQKIYDGVHAALWAVLTACVLYCIVFVLPRVSEIRRNVEMRQANEIAAEDEFYCSKLGMGKGAQRHNECLFYIGEFHSKVEERSADNTDFF